MIKRLYHYIACVWYTFWAISAYRTPGMPMEEVYRLIDKADYHRDRSARS